MLPIEPSNEDKVKIPLKKALTRRVSLFTTGKIDDFYRD
jgi:hypothetical protein